MTVPVVNPNHLLEQSRELARHERGAARQVDLRRAISAAYYAVFHAVLTEGANQLVGAVYSSDPEYAAVYRALGHRTFKDVCADVRKGSLPKKYGALVSLRFANDVKTFCSLVVDLQERRHQADYDPLARFNRPDATAVITSAERAIAFFEQVSPDERRKLIFLLWFGARQPSN